MISRECWNEGDQVYVQTPVGTRSAIIHKKVLFESHNDGRKHKKT